MTRNHLAFVAAALLSLSGASARGDAETPAAKPERPALQPPQSIYDQAFDAARKKATDGWLDDPLKFIHGDMDHCVGELAAFKTDKPVQQVQNTCVDHLDAVIKM